MSGKLKMPAPDEVLSAVERWRKTNVNAQDETFVKDAFGDIFSKFIGVFQRGRGSCAFNRFYRIREVEYLIGHKDEFFAPDSEKLSVKKNHCNFQHESMLYTSTDAANCFDELNVQPGQQVYLICYERRQPLWQRSPFGFDWPSILGPESAVFETKEDELSYRIMRSFIYSEFMRPTCRKCDGSDFIYNFTASLCTAIPRTDTDGFLYPSAVNVFSQNMAFFPEAQVKLDIKSAEVLELVKRDASGDITCCRKFAAETNEEDNVSWLPRTGERWFRRQDGSLKLGLFVEFREA